MSDVGKGIVTLLQTRPAVRDLVAERIYPTWLPKGAARPNVVYHEIDGVSEEHLKGAGGVRHTRLQYDVLADTAIEANQVREQLRLALQGYRGAAGDEDVLGVSVADLRSSFEPPIDGSDRGRYVRSIDFLISHTEAIGIGA